LNYSIDINPLTGKLLVIDYYSIDVDPLTRKLLGAFDIPDITKSIHHFSRREFISIEKPSIRTGFPVGDKYFC